MDMANKRKTKTALADMEELRRLNYQPDEQSPACIKDCFACTDGKCCILKDNDFGDHECPFCKTWDRLKQEQRAGLERLVENGRYGPIEKYESVLAGLGIFALLDDDVQQVTGELELFEEEDLRDFLAEEDQRDLHKEEDLRDLLEETEKEEEWLD